MSTEVELKPLDTSPAPVETVERPQPVENGVQVENGVNVEGVDNPTYTESHEGTQAEYDFTVCELMMFAYKAEFNVRLLYDCSHVRE
ncbi:hypothetical protein DPMN_148279 [Dreissena polymorpha]|uniref:Uncharacterized protein n=1 Tax=Dreissena polymorpha TaxID=45954 RepID=A0A9D4FDR7_DREPO|nr:hypothetical protein DPMN_148279 [Dreissena polymorpha]